MGSEQRSADVGLGSGERVSDKPEERSKPSFLSRMKAKARNLKLKVKSHGSAEDSQDESPRDTLSSGQDESDSDASESDQEGDKHDVPYTPLANAVLPHPQRASGVTAKAEGPPVGAVTSERSALSTQGSTNTDVQSCPVDPALLKTEGPSGHEQAIPTNYNYFNSEPLKADQDVSQRLAGDPSGLGGEFAGLTPATSKRANDTPNRFSAQDGSIPMSGKSDCEVPRSVVRSQDIKQNGMEATGHPRRAITTKPSEENEGVRLTDPSSVGALTPRNSVNDFSEFTGANAPQPSELTANSVTDGSNNDRPFTSSEEGKGLGHGNIGTAEGAKEVMDANWNTPSEEATWTQKANGLKDSLASTFGYAGNSAESNIPCSDGEQKPFMDRVTETAYSLENAVVGKFYSADHITSTDSITVSQKVSECAVPGKDLSPNAIDSGDHDLSSDETPDSVKASEATLQAKEAGLQMTTPDDQGKRLSDSITESIVSLPGMLSSKLGLGGGSPTSPPPTSAEVTQPGSVFKDGSDAPTAVTPTSNSPYDPSTRKDTPYPEQPSATSTGLFDRVSDIASSLFGLGAKQAPTELGKSASLEKTKQPPTELGNCSSLESKSI